MTDSLVTPKILPVVTFSPGAGALPVAKALLKCWLTIMKIGLHTDQVLKAITVTAQNFPEMKPGAHSILAPAQIEHAIDAGSGFCPDPSVMTSAESGTARQISHSMPGPHVNETLQYSTTEK